MKILSFAVILLSLAACGSGEDSATEKEVIIYQKIHILQARQHECMRDNNPQSGIFDEFLMREIWRRAKEEVDYKCDTGEDYWQTACETHLTKEGDCEDLAIYATNVLREYGFADSMLGCIYATHPNGDHVFAAAFPDGPDKPHWLLDHSGIHWSEEVYKEYKPEVGFNFFTEWDCDI